MSQVVLSHRLGITFQQVQKYEKGSNRIGSSRLQAIADAMGVSVAFFFADGPLEIGNSARESLPTDELVAFLDTAEGLALNRAFAAIASATVRKKALGLIKAVAADVASPDPK